MSPTDHDANRQTPFYKRLAERAPTWVQPIVAPQFNTVESVLQTCGLRPEDIDYISYDHLHTQDVRRWLAGPKPYFPKAQLLVHKQEWASTLSLLPIQAEWYCPQGIAGIPAERVVTFEGSLSLGPGVALIHTPGHTEGNHSLAARVPDGIRVTSENGVGVDAYEPKNSRINAVRRCAGHRQRGHPQWQHAGGQQRPVHLHGAGKDLGRPLGQPRIPQLRDVERTHALLALPG